MDTLVSSLLKKHHLFTVIWFGYREMQDIEESVKFYLSWNAISKIWLYLLQLDFYLILAKIMTKSHKFSKINLEVISDIIEISIK